MSTAQPQPQGELALWQLAQLHERAAGEIAAISRRIRKRRLVVFFGREDFSDNTKYLYLNAVARERDYDVVWATPRSELADRLTRAGLPALDLNADTDATVATLLHAAVVVYCVNPDASTGGERLLTAAVDGARKVQLWHGVSAKHLVLQLVDHLSVLNPALREPWELSSRADHVLSTTPELDGYWREVFGCRALVRAGLPRNEMLVREPTDHELIGAELGPEAADALATPGRRKVLVVPTWQRNTALTIASRDWLDEFVACARARKVDLFLKLHPVYARTISFDRPTFGPGCYVIQAGVDVYPWLRLFDALVTDYSSIMFDFLLTGKPVARLDIPDRGHESFEPDLSLVPGGVEFAYTYRRGRVQAVLDTMLSKDFRADARQVAAQRLFPTEPKSACEDLMAFVESLVAEVVAEDWTVANRPPGPR